MSKHITQKQVDKLFAAAEKVRMTDNGVSVLLNTRGTTRNKKAMIRVFITPMVMPDGTKETTLRELTK